MKKLKNPVVKKTTSSHPMLPAAETTTPTMASVTGAATAPYLDRMCKRWGLPCQFCAQPAPHPSPVDSDWSEEDWDGDIEREQEKKNKERNRWQRNTRN